MVENIGKSSRRLRQHQAAVNSWDSDEHEIEVTESDTKLDVKGESSNSWDSSPRKVKIMNPSCESEKHRNKAKNVRLKKKMNKAKEDETEVLPFVFEDSDLEGHNSDEPLDADNESRATTPMNNEKFFVLKATKRSMSHHSSSSDSSLSEIICDEEFQPYSESKPHVFVSTPKSGCGEAILKEIFTDKADNDIEVLTLEDLNSDRSETVVGGEARKLNNLMNLNLSSSSSDVYIRDCDDTVWEIPHSPTRSISSVSDTSTTSTTSQLIANLGHKGINVKRVNSCSDVKLVPTRLTSSKSLGDVTEYKPLDFINIDWVYEGSLNNPNKVKEKVEQDSIKNIMNYLINPPGEADGVQNFQELECWVVTTDGKAGVKDAHTSSDDEDGVQNTSGGVSPTVQRVESRNVKLRRTAPADSYGRREATTSIPALRSTSKEIDIAQQPVTESWVLLDEVGHSQQVTATEASFLLGEHSAEYLRSTSTEHHLPSARVIGRFFSQYQDLDPIVKGSLSLLDNEDLGGEENANRPIGLERKLDNILLYIASRTDLPASVRFIPIDRKMISLWRHSKDSLVSSLVTTSGGKSSAVAVDDEDDNTSNTSEKNPTCLKKIDTHEKMNIKKQKKTELIASDNVVTDNKDSIAILTEELKNTRCEASEAQRLLGEEQRRTAELEKELNKLRQELKSQVRKLEKKSEDDNCRQTVLETGEELEDENCSVKCSNNGKAAKENLKVEQKSQYSGLLDRPSLNKSSGWVHLDTVGHTAEEYKLKVELETLKIKNQQEKSALAEENIYLTQKLNENIIEIEERDIFDKKLLNELEELRGLLEKNGYVFEFQQGISHTSKYRHLDSMGAFCLFMKKITQNVLLSGLPVDFNKLKNYNAHSSLENKKLLKSKIASNRQEIGVDEYCTLLADVSTISDQLDKIKTERDLLLEAQVDNYDKLKALNSDFSDNCLKYCQLETALSKAQEERSNLIQKLDFVQKENRALKNDVDYAKHNVAQTRSKKESLKEEMERKTNEIMCLTEKLEFSAKEQHILQETCRTKDDIINRLRLMEKEIEVNETTSKRHTSEVIKALENDKFVLENDLRIAEIARKEMNEYVSRLEVVASGTEERLAETQNLWKESNNSLKTTKKVNETLSKQMELEVTINTKMKDEVVELKKVVKNLEDDLEILRKSKREVEERQKKDQGLYEDRLKCECERYDVMQQNLEEHKAVYENCLRDKQKSDNLVSEIRQDASDLLQEKNHLLTEVETWKRENERLDEKYRTLKRNCDERTNIIIHMEKLFRKSVQEKSSKIQNLENDTSLVLVKMTAYKERINVLEENITGLRKCLDASKQEKESLERDVSNYYTLVKRLQKDVKEKNAMISESKVKVLEVHENSRKLKSPTHRMNETGPTDPKGLKHHYKPDVQTEFQLQIHHAEYEHERTELLNEIKDLKAEAHKNELRIEVLTRNIVSCGKMRSELETLKKINEDLIKRNNQLELVEQELRQWGSQQVNKIAILSKIVDNNNNETSKERIVELNEEIKTLKRQLSEAQQIISDMKLTMEANKEDKKKTLLELQTTHKELAEEKTAHKFSERLLEQKNKHIRKLESQNKEAEVTELSEKSRTLKSVQKLQTELTIKKQRIQDLQTQLAVSQDRYTRLKQDVVKAGTRNLPSETHKHGDLNSGVKEAREANLHLRKIEGDLKKTIVQMEEARRNDRLLIKELQGDIQSSRTLISSFRNVLLAAKRDIEHFKVVGQINFQVAERIERHLDISSISTFQPFSDFRK